MKMVETACPECKGWGGFKDCRVCGGAGTLTTAEIPEHGIVFSERLVRAIDEDRKTVTRRVVRPRTTKVMRPKSAWPERSRRDGDPRGGGQYLHVPYTLDRAEPGDGEGGEITNRIYCPYGDPGDRLWVREAHAFHPTEEDQVFYRALHQHPEEVKWRSARFMPKWAARTWLEIERVGVERLHDITLEQIQAEGVSFSDMEGAEGRRAVFHRGWDSINGKRDGCAWVANPWVWTITFRKVTT
jgi:hypothetical protein